MHSHIQGPRCCPNNSRLVTSASYTCNNTWVHRYRRCTRHRPRHATFRLGSRPPQSTSTTPSQTTPQLISLNCQSHFTCRGSFPLRGGAEILYKSNFRAPRPQSCGRPPTGCSSHQGGPSDSQCLWSCPTRCLPTWATTSAAFTAVTLPTNSPWEPSSPWSSPGPSW